MHLFVTERKTPAMLAVLKHLWMGRIKFPDREVEDNRRAGEVVSDEDEEPEWEATWEPAKNLEYVPWSSLRGKWRSRMQN